MTVSVECRLPWPLLVELTQNEDRRQELFGHDQLYLELQRCLVLVGILNYYVIFNYCDET